MENFAPMDSERRHKWTFKTMPQVHYIANSIMRYIVVNERSKRWTKVIEGYKRLLWVIDKQHFPPEYEPPASYAILCRCAPGLCKIMATLASYLNASSHVGHMTSDLVSGYVAVSELVSIVNFSAIAGFLSFLGIVTNVINVTNFYKMGFSDTVNISLFTMALSDLLMTTLTAWMSLCANPLFRYSDLPFEAADIHTATTAWLRLACLRLSGMATVYVALERCLCVMMPLKFKAVLTHRKTTKVMCTFAMVAIFVGLPLFPLWGIFRLGSKFFPSRNKTLIGIVPLQETLDLFLNLTRVTSVLAYAILLSLVVLTSALLLQLHRQAKWRQTLAADDNKALEMSKRDVRLQKMLISLCCVYIVCFIPQPTLIIIASGFVPGFTSTGSQQSMFEIMWAVKNNFETANVCANFFIYFTINRKFRSVFRRTFLSKPQNKMCCC